VKSLGKKRVRWIGAEAASAWAKKRDLLVSKTVLIREARQASNVLKSVVKIYGETLMKQDYWKFLRAL
jgi:hypothetical protein|tara:strand:+ start:226 stop:429 length:204 start_codon:yes stop_codon:yes gene_type:complete